MKQYHKRLMSLVLTRPGKIPALYKLKIGAKKLEEKKLLSTDCIAPPPVTIAIRPTYRCNLRCIQCGQWGDKGYLKKVKKEFFHEDNELTTKQIKDLIDEVSHFKPFIYFTGGEPLIRDDIFELIEHASSKDLVVGMSTNATLLGEKSIDLIRSGIDYVYTSLDGTPKVNALIRKGDESAQRAISGIKSLISTREKKRSSLPIVEVRTTVTEENQHDLIATAEFVDKELGADVFCLALCVYTTSELEKSTRKRFANELDTDEKCWQSYIRDNYDMDYESIEKQVNLIYKRSWNFVFHPYKPLGNKNFDYEIYFTQPERPMGNVSMCTGLYGFVQIQPNGDVATCASIPDYMAGNIKKERFMDIWNGARYKKIRESTKKAVFASCTRCKHNYTFRKY